MRYYRLVKYVSNWWLHLAAKAGAAKADPLVFRTRKGLSVEVPKRLTHTFKEIFMEDSYLKGLEKGLPENPVVFDIGANAGYFSLFAATVLEKPRIFAFEPVPANFEQLKRNVGLNPGAGIKAFNEAASGSCGVITLTFDPEDSFTTSASVIERDDGQNGRLEVPCSDLPSLFEKTGADECHILKLDCEGSEYEILYSCPDSCLERISRAAIEVHQGTEKGQDMASLQAFMESKGFETTQWGNILQAWRGPAQGSDGG